MAEKDKVIYQVREVDADIPGLVRAYAATRPKKTKIGDGLGQLVRLALKKINEETQ